MIKRNLLALRHLVRNAAAHHRNTWLPYGVILLCLAGIWWGWDGVPSGRQEIIRETKNNISSSPPVFSSSDRDEEEERPEGRLVEGTAPSLRRRPLPDIFAGSAPKSAADSAEKARPVAAAPAAELPVLCGTMEHNGAYLALFRHRGETLVCAAGDSFDGYTVVSVYQDGAQLEKDGICAAVSM